MPSGRRAPSAFTQAVAAELRAAAARQKLRPSDLAERTRIPVQTLRKLLAGDSAIDVEQLNKLADALRMQPRELIELATRAMKSDDDRRDADIQVAAYESPEPKGLPEPEQP